MVQDGVEIFPRPGGNLDETIPAISSWAAGGPGGQKCGVVCNSGAWGPESLVLSAKLGAWALSALLGLGGTIPAIPKEWCGLQFWAWRPKSVITRDPQGGIGGAWGGRGRGPPGKCRGSDTWTGPFQQRGPSADHPLEKPFQHAGMASRDTPCLSVWGSPCPGPRAPGSGPAPRAQGPGPGPGPELLKWFWGVPRLLKPGPPLRRPRHVATADPPQKKPFQHAEMGGEVPNALPSGDGFDPTWFGPNSL